MAVPHMPSGAEVSMSFREMCERADRRYKWGDSPEYIEPEGWARAREVQAKLRRGSIPPTWNRPEWTLERLHAHFLHVANQARLRAKGKPRA